MINQDVKSGKVRSGYVERPFDEAKVELEKEGYKIISLEQFAKLRIKEGKDSHVANYGAYTKEGFLYLPNKEIRFTPNSPIMANAKEATQCHRSGKEFYLTDKQVEEAVADSIVVKVKSGNTIPTNRFGEDELTAYTFGKTAKAYGEFLREAGITAMPVYLANITDKPFARQAWLHRLGSDYRSGLYGNGGCLSYVNAVRGVRMASTEGAKPAKIYVPNLKEVLKYSRQFVPEVARKDFEKGLEAIFKRQ